MSFRVRSVLLSILTLLLISCQAGSDGDEKAEEAEPAADEAAEGESGEQAEAGPVLLPIEVAAEEELPGRIVVHLDNLWLVGKPLTDICERFGDEMNQFFDLVQADFDAAAGIDLTEDERKAIVDSYQRLSTLGGRCLKDEDGRRFSKRLLTKVKAIRGES